MLAGVLRVLPALRPYGSVNVVLVNPEIESLSDQSVRERLEACLPWLKVLLPKLLKQAPLPELPYLRKFYYSGFQGTAIPLEDALRFQNEFCLLNTPALQYARF